MSKASILVVEDDPPVRNLITTTLGMHQYEYLVAGNGQTAIMQAASHNPDVIFLDLGLPDMDGVDVIRKVRTWTEIPIIVISARSEEADKIEALDAGADDYLTKPFSVEELLARLRVSLRRMALMKSADHSDPVFRNGALTIDYPAETASLGGQELHLTPIEYKLLKLLAKYEGKVLTYAYITKEIWGRTTESELASLRVFMATLRRKLEPDRDSSQFIQTHIGIGYRMLKVEEKQ
ncbi:MAG: response regulator transcription factor [Eubacterium sp.]|jgi:two-component system KDP operon response regulator KdpE|nr:response regulator transcription factor [[Eubacterium] cellulosolvens]MCR4652546.1 response regulator transcription factor [Eubacterium sp.]